MEDIFGYTSGSFDPSDPSCQSDEIGSSTDDLISEDLSISSNLLLTHHLHPGQSYYLLDNRIISTDDPSESNYPGFMESVSMTEHTPREDETSTVRAYSGIHLYDNQEKATKRKRRYYMTIEQRNKEDELLKRRYKLTFSKIVRNDLRREYPLMYVNVMNSINPTLIVSFFKKFCRPTVKFTDDVPRALFGHNSTINIRGADALATQFATMFTNVPDAVMSLSKASIIRRYNRKGSILMMDISFKANYIVHLDVNPDDLLSVIDGLSISSDTNTSTANSVDISSNKDIASNLTAKMSQVANENGNEEASIALDNDSSNLENVSSGESPVNFQERNSSSSSLDMIDSAYLQMYTEKKKETEVQVIPIDLTAHIIYYLDEEHRIKKIQSRGTMNI